MEISGDLTFTGALKRRGYNLFAEEESRYLNDLNLVRGLIGGGYLGGSGYTTITLLAYGTDTWSTSASTVNRSLKYGGWASAHAKGYFLLNNQDNYNGNDRIDFATEVVTAIGTRGYTGDAPSTLQHGIGYDAQGGAPYGYKAYTAGTASTGYDKLTFNTDTFVSATDSNIMSSSHWVAWFDRDYGFAFAGNTTFMYPFVTETWRTITTISSPGALGHSGDYLTKGLNSKLNKFYLTTGYVKVFTLWQFQNHLSTWSTNRTGQTLRNCETAGTMGQAWGYFAGGYNDVTGQNAHTDKMQYYTDTVVNITDSPRSLSSASATWSPI